MSLVNWVIDTFAREDVIDLSFILTDLVDINISEAEIFESALLDFTASATVREHNRESNMPVGKRVL